MEKGLFSAKVPIFTKDIKIPKFHHFTQSMNMDHNNIFYSFSRFGLANRILGLASAMHVGRFLRRPLVLVWEENHHIGETCFGDLFDNSIPTVRKKPSGLPVIAGDKPQTKESFPIGTPVILECHDICMFPGLAEKDIRSGLRELRPVPSIQERVVSFTDSHDFENVIGVHIRYGDKRRNNCSRRLWMKIQSQYDMAIREIIRTSNASIYLSCDDATVWNGYRRLHGDRIIGAKKVYDPLFRDRNSIPEALIDLYLLSKTRALLYGVGTFGYAAHVLGGNIGHNILRSKTNFFFSYALLEKRPRGSFPDVRTIIDEVTI